MIQKPIKKPNNLSFSSGPCAKRPNWKFDNLSNAAIGRSHRSVIGKQKLKQVIDTSKEVLGIPKDYFVGIVPASDTGAMEMAMWSLLGSKKVDVYAWESFSKTWLADIVEQLQLDNNQYCADYGQISDFSNYDKNNDCVFVYNGTTSGVKVPNLNWIASDREGLTICDATSAVFAQDIDFSKLDVTTWSWQKSLGSEGGHGMIALSPRAVARLESYNPPWAMPKIFRMTKDSKLNEALFQGATINTPSLICAEDVLDSMNWIKSIGGLKASMQRSDNNLKVISDWVSKTDWVDFLAKDESFRSNTSVCLIVTEPKFVALAGDEQKAMIKKLCVLLEKENAGYDFNAYKVAPAGMRIWCGPTIEQDDVKVLLEWIEWAFFEIRK